MVSRNPSARAIIEPIETSATPESALLVTARGRLPAILESTQLSAIRGWNSIYANDPADTITVPGQSGLSSVSPLRRLAQRVDEWPKLDSLCGEVPFAGGWMGYIAYEANLAGGRVLPPGRNAGPLVRFGLYDHGLVFDHVTGRWYAFAIDWPNPRRSSRPEAKQRLDSLRARVRMAESRTDALPPTPSRVDAVSNMSPDAYRAKVARAIAYIEAGDIYQVNLAQRFRVRTEVEPLQLYRRLRGLNPSPYAAYLAYDDEVVLSSSPELFLDLRGQLVVTRPIKGTRPRIGMSDVDSVRRRELEESEKERAELVMIVDLLRNDLGRVCEYGSVRVTHPGEIEEHPTVFHRVATVEGRVAPGRDWINLLEGAFPGGSVTGAPKLRAMQIIRELEPTPRGVYCGAIGWIGLNGDISLNLAIRTMVQKRGVVDVFAGGAIMAESDPQAESEEIRAKAAGMFAALNVRRATATVPRRRQSKVATA